MSKESGRNASNTEFSCTLAVEPGIEIAAEQEKLDDKHIVDWTGPDDPENPHNWPSLKRWAHIVLVSVFALISNMGPTMCAPGISYVVTDLNIASQTLGTLAITLYVLGLAIGPMVASPLSEVYGRLFVYHTANAVFVAFIIGTGLSRTTAQFIILRFLSGCAAGTPMSLVGVTIADLTTPAKRGLAMSLFSLGPLTGPVLGPVIGGFVASSLGWRWTFYLLALFAGVAGVASAVMMRETKPKTILERRAARLRVSTGNADVRSTLARTLLSPRMVLVQALVRPVMLLMRSPILLVLSSYVSLVFGTMYLLFTTFTDVFETQYGFTTALSGLAYLGLGMALPASMVLFQVLNERVTKAQMVADGVDAKRPEYSLILMIWFSPLVGFGLIIYGWTAEYHVHWIVPIIGTTIIGFGAFFVIMPAQLYIVVLFGSEASASALSANNLLRFLSSTFLPLAGPSMYAALGYGWGNTLLGILALSFVAAPITFYKYGERMRAREVLKL